MARYHSFLVRIWCSDGSDGEQFAGRLDYLQSGESRRFRDLEELGAFLHEVLGVGDLHIPARQAAEAPRADGAE